MKAIFIIILIVFNYISTFSQTKNWNKFKLDSIILFSAPSENLYKLDTIIEEVKINQLFITINNGTFIAQK